MGSGNAIPTWSRIAICGLAPYSVFRSRYRRPLPLLFLVPYTILNVHILFAEISEKSLFDHRFLRRMANSARPPCPPSLLDFTNTFILSSTPNSEQTLFEVPKPWTIDPSRQSQTHQKSRTGCRNCRRRRVKVGGSYSLS